MSEVPLVLRERVKQLRKGVDELFGYGRYGFWGMGCNFFCHGPWEIPFYTKEQELSFLKRRAAMLREELAWVEERIKELEKEK
ncbi:MAG: DUF5320 domain-containing protein [Atribacterota bacterium]|nr:DUF5320 domain-containing protein [Atribacterota bacterium]